MSNTDTCLNCEHRWADHGQEICGQTSLDPNSPYACGCTRVSNDRPTPTRVELYDEQEGEWGPVDGITHIEITPEPGRLVRILQPTPEQREQLLTTMTRVSQGLAAFAEALQQARPMAEQFEAAGRRTRDRPAWQSPYGPPTRNH
ncbi:hypothetical protein [Streptomyces altiplanensis]